MRKCAANRLRSMKYSHGPLAVPDDDVRSRADARHQYGEIARYFRLGDVDYMLSHTTVIPRPNS
jgi:hypothetical protein